MKRFLFLVISSVFLFLFISACQTQQVDINIQVLMDELDQLRRDNDALRDVIQNQQAGNPADTGTESTPAQTQPLPPTPEPRNRIYLERDIFATNTEGRIGDGTTAWLSSDTWRGYPGAGSFTMGGELYTRGINMSGTFNIPAWSAGIYDISGQNFTRLTGMFGRVGDRNGDVSITFQCVDCGRFLGEFTSATGDFVREISIDIPSDATRIRVSLHSNTMNVSPGFGNAFFE